MAVWRVLARDTKPVISLVHSSALLREVHPTSAVGLQYYRTFSSTTSANRSKGGPNLKHLLQIAAFLGSGVGLTLLLDELELRKAAATLERGSKPSPAVLGSALLKREPLQQRLRELLTPGPPPTAGVDIIFGHEGTGKSTEVQRAVAAIEGGVLYVDLAGSGAVGERILETLAGGSRGSLQRLRDAAAGGPGARGFQLLETAVQRYVAAHNQCPVVAFDHVDPQACHLNEASSPFARLEHAASAQSPALRTVIVLDDVGLETLEQEAAPSTSYSLAAEVDDAAPSEAQAFLVQHGLPRELAARVVSLVGGRLSHLQLARSYWQESHRWLSPNRPGASWVDAAVTAHFTEIKKLVYWELDHCLRIRAGINLWPSATGDAPVKHQTPADEDAEIIVALLHAIHTSPLPAAAVRVAVGEARLRRLLEAQVLGLMPQPGPLRKDRDLLVDFGSPAMRAYYEERLAKSSGGEDAKEPKGSSRGWVW